MIEKEIEIDLEQDLLNDYSTSYLLTKEETAIFINLVLQEADSPYTPFILVLYKEVGNDIAKFLRVITSASKTPGFAPRGLIRKVLMTIREAIVIHEIGTNKHASITELTKRNRYRQIGINRNAIYQVIYKYELR